MTFHRATNRKPKKANKVDLCEKFEKVFHPKTDYEAKFADFIRMCRETRRNGVVVIASPWVIGDTYAEVSESLKRLTEAGLRLAIVKGHLEEYIALLKSREAGTIGKGP